MEIPEHILQEARNVDLLALAEQDTTLKRVAATNGGEHAGPCPFCKEGTDRFRVWAGHNRWYCRGCGNNRSYDAIEYVMRRDDLSFYDAVEQLAGPLNGNARRPAAAPLQSHMVPTPLAPPNEQWQGQARRFVEQCQQALWSEEGRKALGWLLKRGMEKHTIRAAGLGYNPSDRYEDRVLWGLTPVETNEGKQKQVWLPRGIVIPWEVSGELWRVNIRRSPSDLEQGDPKYMGPAGWSNALYGADRIVVGKPVMIVEGEFDAITINQIAHDLVVAVATGSTHGARKPKWIGMLALAPQVLVSFDADDAGEQATEYWTRLPNATCWRPYWGDANQMAQEGAHVRRWVYEGLHYAGATIPHDPFDELKDEADATDRIAMRGPEVSDAFWASAGKLNERFVAGALTQVQYNEQLALLQRRALSDQ